MIKLGAFVVVLALACEGCGGNVVVDSYDLNAAEQVPAPTVLPPSSKPATLLCDPAEPGEGCDDSDDCTADMCGDDGRCSHVAPPGCAQG